MQYAVLIVFILLIIFVAALMTQRVVIFEYQSGLLYSRGKFVRVLKPGAYWCFRPFHTLLKIDMRSSTITIPGQEVLTSDNIGLKFSIAVSFRVTDPYLAINKVVNYQEALYQLLQLHLRDIVGTLAVDDLLANRAEIGKQLYEKSTAQAAGLGVELMVANVKDIMFPGELKNTFAQVVNARKEGLAALERARGESAALRNLANAARSLDNNPSLQQLRLYQVLEKNSGNTVVIMPPESPALGKLLGKPGTKED